MLREREYFFCVGDEDPSNNMYPVVPSFDHWRFPRTLPSPWKDVQIENRAPTSVMQPGFMVQSRDVTCRISGHGNALEVAHLVPVADGYWFQANSMYKYCRGQRAALGVTNDRNMVLLRSDLHHLFDTRRFTFAAKYVSRPAPAPAEPRAPAPAEPLPASTPRLAPLPSPAAAPSA
ncbi:hypothetical protein RB595_003932 [Gaeumannomyces hyphopodioides]